MKKRGKILRDTSAGPGLIMADGQQYSFSLEGLWKSEEAPRVGMVVDLDFGDQESITGIRAVPESQLAREQAEATMDAARKHGAALASGAVARFGIPSLVGGAALVLGWWMLPAASVNAFGASGHVTFWQILGYVNAGTVTSFGGGGSPSVGIYGLLAIIALAGPFAYHFWKDKRALLGGLLPLIFMLMVALMLRNAMGAAGAGGGELGEFANRMRDEAMKAISIGSGVYISLLASLYFAASGTIKFLATKASEVQR